MQELSEYRNAQDMKKPFAGVAKQYQDAIDVKGENESSLKTVFTKNE